MDLGLTLDLGLEKSFVLTLRLEIKFELASRLAIEQGEVAKKSHLPWLWVWAVGKANMGTNSGAFGFSAEEGPAEGGAEKEPRLRLGSGEGFFENAGFDSAFGIDAHFWGSWTGRIRCTPPVDFSSTESLFRAA